MITTTLLCDVNAVEMSERVEAYLRGSIVWEKRLETQKRIKVVKDLFTAYDDDCPIEIVVTRPIVNILPLTIMLALWFIVNLAVSYTVSKHGNALDSAFHLIKETLGHDSTSNPLESNLGRNELSHLKLHNWKCTSGGGGHVGFIGREGDIPVEDFESDIVVGGCAHTKADLKRAVDLCRSADVSSFSQALKSPAPKPQASLSPDVVIPVNQTIPGQAEAAFLSGSVDNSSQLSKSPSGVPPSIPPGTPSQPFTVTSWQPVSDPEAPQPLDYEPTADMASVSRSEEPVTRNSVSSGSSPEAPRPPERSSQ